MTSNWTYATGEPELQLAAELVGGLAEPVVSVPRRLFGGGWAVLAEPGTARRPVGGLLVLEDDLSIVGQFPVPEEIFAEPDPDGDWPRYWVDTTFPNCRFDVSPDRRFAVFTSANRIVVVDRDGSVRWQVTHPVRLSMFCEDDRPTPSSAVFSADGGTLWACVPVSGSSAAENPTVQRWRIDVTNWRTTVRATTQYGLDTDLLLHPDGRHAGYAFRNGFVIDDPNGPNGRWMRWNGDEPEEVIISGQFTPVDVHRSGDRWLAIDGDDHALCLGDFRGGPVREILPLAGVDEDPDVYAEEIDEILAACLVTPGLVLTCLYDSSADEGDDLVHVVFEADPPQRKGIVRYPPNGDVPAGGRQMDAVAIRSTGDGTWLTFAPSTGVGLLKRWRLRVDVSR